MQSDAKAIAEGLTKAHLRFLDALAEGKSPGLADREEDKVRQKCRRLGLAAWCGKPVHWQIASLGLAVKDQLERMDDD